MKKFIVIYHAPADAWKAQKDKSPEDMKKGMEEWMVWAKKCGEGLVDMGAPLGNGQKVSKEGSSKTEGNVAGYSVLQAENMEGALEMLQDHPHLGWAEGCDIEVFEEMPLPK